MKELIQKLVIENMEIFTMMSTEVADAYVMDLLYDYFKRFSPSELQEEAERLGIE